MTTRTNESSAWLTDCGGGVLAAIGIPNVLHVVEDTSLLFRVPLAPAHCNRVLLWQNRVLPVVDLSVLLATKIASARSLYSCVLGWRDAGGVTEYGVLLSRALPRRILISDSQRAEPLDTDVERWRGIALGFFSYHKHITPIVDPAALFGSTQAFRHLSEAGRAHRIA